MKAVKLLCLAFVLAGAFSLSAKADSSLFSQQLPDINVTISKGDLKKILENPLEEKCYPATVEIGGELFYNVGFRAKGNSTLVNSVREELGKIAFKLDFAEYVPGSYYGVEVINLNTEYLDPSFMREALTYDAFEYLGVPAPLRSYANLYVNGKHFGFYLAVENIGTEFLMRNYQNSIGELYKPDGGSADLRWYGDSKSDYSGMSTKNASGKNMTALIQMLGVLNGVYNDVDLNEVLNIDEVLRYIAVNAAFVNYDSYLARSPHNYYLYENNGRFDIIPWDLAMAFGVKPMKHYTDIPLTQLYIDEPADGKYAEKALLTNLLSVSQYKEQYHLYLRDIAENLLSEAAFAKKITALKGEIASHIKNDENSIYSHDDFEEDCRYLLHFACARSESILKQLSGEEPSMGDLLSSEDEAVPVSLSSNKGTTFSKSFKKLAKNIRGDLSGIAAAFKNADAPEISEERYGEGAGVLTEKYYKDMAVFRTNLIMILAAALAVLIFCIYLSKKKRF